MKFPAGVDREGADDLTGGRLRDELALVSEEALATPIGKAHEVQGLDAVPPKGHVHHGRRRAVHERRDLIDVLEPRGANPYLAHGASPPAARRAVSTARKRLASVGLAM